MAPTGPAPGPRPFPLSFSNSPQTPASACHGSGGPKPSLSSSLPALSCHASGGGAAACHLRFRDHIPPKSCKTVGTMRSRLQKDRDPREAVRKLRREEHSPGKKPLRTGRGGWNPLIASFGTKKTDNFWKQSENFCRTISRREKVVDGRKRRREILKCVSWSQKKLTKPGSSAKTFDARFLAGKKADNGRK